MTRLRVCDSREIEPGEVRQFDHSTPIAIYNVDGDFFATADTCSHDKSSLADGYVEGDQVECAWHFAKFCIRTGQVLSPPATQSIPTYPVVVEDGVLYVELD